MTAPPVPRLWDLIDQAQESGDVTALHLAIGRPPMIRVRGEDLRPLPGDHPTLTGNTVSVMLSLVIEPEQWDRLEQTGDGEISLTPEGGGRGVRLSGFCTSEAG